MSRNELAQGVASRPPDYFLGLRQSAYRAIAEARKRVENDIGFYSPLEMKEAEDFLRSLANAARCTGKPRGDKPRAAENHKMLRVFWELSRGKALKEIAIDMEGGAAYEGKVRSLSVQIKRFSQRAHASYCERHGSVSQSIYEDGAHERAWGYLSSLFGSIARWPGVKSNCREHGYALCEALRRYTANETKQNSFVVVGRLSQLS